MKMELKLDGGWMEFETKLQDRCLGGYNLYYGTLCRRAER